MKIITRENYFAAVDSSRADYHSEYYAMYSSIMQGITCDPLLMQIPVDDHLVHRGDGIFETFKCVDGGIYNLDAHLERFYRSAGLLAFSISWTPDEIRDLTIQTLRAGMHRDAAVRLMLSRGPGSFNVNPYDCRGPQLFIIASKLKPSFMEEHPGGASLGISSVAAKLSFFARVKNCNYLPNVLMKKEAVDRKLDFVAGFDSNGYLTEGATENIGILTSGGELAFPTLDSILCGTTMIRVMDIAKEHAAELGIRSVTLRNISEQDMRDAAEIIIAGTTPDVTAVRDFEGTATPLPVPGRVAAGLDRLLKNDIHNNESLRIPAFQGRL